MRPVSIIATTLLLLLTAGAQLPAQYSSLGKDFRFGFLQNRTLDNGQSSTGGNGDVRVAIFVSNHSGTDVANVEVRYERNPVAIDYVVDGVPTPAIGGVLSVDVPPFTGTLIEFTPAPGYSPADLQIMGSGRTDSRSYRVTSSQTIALYAQSWQNASRDVSLILPTSSLGADYVVAAPHPTPHARSRFGGPAEFAIVAVEENTTVRFTLPRPITVRLPGQTPESIPAGERIVQLDEGETYQIQTDSLDLSGIRVYSEDCKPFALFAGNMAVDVPTTSGGTWDHVYEQMFPRRSWGRRYVTTPVTDGLWDLFKIIAADDNTTITIDGTQLETPNGTLRLARGEVLEISDQITTSRGQTVVTGPTRIGDATFISASAPIAVAQIGLSSNMNRNTQDLDPFMIILSPVEQSIDAITFASLPAPRRYLNVVAHQFDRDQIRIESEAGVEGPITDFSTWQQVGATNWYWAVVDLAGSFPPGLNYRLTSSGGTGGFNAYIYGLDRVEGYGYAAGVNLDPLQGRRMLDRRICAGDTINLLAAEGDQWRWSDDSSLSCLDCRDPKISPDTTTTYTVEIRRGCVVLLDTVEIRVDPVPVITTPSDTAICPGDSVAIAITGPDPFLIAWDPADGLDCDDCTTPTLRPSRTTTYLFTATNEFECSIRDSFTVTVYDLPQLQMPDDDTVCRDESIPLPIRTSGATAIVWDASDDLDCLDCYTPTASPTESSTYVVTLIGEGGCTVTDSVRITVVDYPVIELLPDTVLCDVNSLRPVVSIDGAEQVSWSPSRDLSCDDCPDPVLTPTQADTWVVTAIGPGGCTTVDSIAVIPSVRPRADAGPDHEICIGDTVTLGDPGDPGTDGWTYAWNPSEEMPFADAPWTTVAPRETTTFYHVVTGPFGVCQSIDSVRVVVRDSTILRLGLEGSSFAPDGRRLSVPIILLDDPGERVITDLDITLRYDPRVMVLEPATIGAGRFGTLLEGWQMEILRHDTGFLHLRFIPSNGNDRLGGPGTLLPIIGRIYLGPIAGSTVGVEVTTSAGCTRIEQGDLRINIDSICATAHRLVEITSGRLRPPLVIPNPVLDRATISFEIPLAGPTSLTLLDALGREIDVLLDGELAAGIHELDWSSAGLPAGLYQLQLVWSGVQRDVRVVVQ